MQRPDDAGGALFYRRLQVGPGATRHDIVRAYRRLALGVHPDAHPEDPEAARRFQELTEAYEVLADPARRAAYDRGGLGHRVPVQVRPAEPRTTETPRPMHETTPVVLGHSAVTRRPPRQVPLRVGPVRVDNRTEHLRAPGRAPLTEVLMEILEWWWRS